MIPYLVLTNKKGSTSQFALGTIYMQANCLHILYIIYYLNQWHYGKTKPASQYPMGRETDKPMRLITKNCGHLKSIKIDY